MPTVARRLVGLLTVALLLGIGVMMVGGRPFAGAVLLGLAGLRAWFLVQELRADRALRDLPEDEPE